jgi:Flp pilus assembly protein TadG
MTTVLVAFLMVSAWSLISASQQWGARRDAYAAAAAAARAAAQADPHSLRHGLIVDEAMAVDRAQAVLTAAGYQGSVVVEGERVTVTVNAPVEYAFPSPGFPSEVTGTATAVARRGVNGDEGG